MYLINEMETEFIILAREGNLKKVKTMWENNAFSSKIVCKAFMDTAIHGRLETARYLDQLYEMDKSSMYGVSLHTSVENNHADFVRFILDKWTWRPSIPIGALYRALDNNNETIIDMLCNNSKIMK